MPEWVNAKAEHYVIRFTRELTDDLGIDFVNHRFREKLERLDVSEFPSEIRCPDSIGGGSRSDSLDPTLR